MKRLSAVMKHFVYYLLLIREITKELSKQKWFQMSESG